MDAILIVIDSEAELQRAHALVDRLMASDDSADRARLQAQVSLITAYEKKVELVRSLYVRKFLNRRLEQPDGFMQFFGGISLLTGWAGALIPYVTIDSGWGGLLAFLLFICVGIAHNWLATGKLST